MEKFATVFGTFILGLMGTILAIILSGFVMSKLWLWFLVPTFNVEPLRIIECLGIAMLIQYLLPPKIDKDTSFLERFATSIASALLTLLLGWILTGFM